MTLGITDDAESQSEILRDLVEFMVRAIVDAPDDVKATAVEDGETVVVEVAVAREDIGKVIGREGGMAQALRTILANAGTKLKRRTALQILD